MTIDASITQKLTHNARASLAHAHTIAQRAHAPHIASEHMLYSIFLQRGSAGTAILHGAGYTKKIFEGLLFVPDTAPGKRTPGSLPLHENLAAHITDAYASAAQFGYPYVGTEHITHAILQSPTPEIESMMTYAQKNMTQKESAQKQSNNNNNTPQIPQDVLSHIGHILGHDGLAFLDPSDSGDENIFDHLTVDASLRGKENIFVGYAETCDRITTILGRRTKNNPILVGQPGVGKTALIEHLAYLATTPDAPAHLRGKKILTLDLALLVAGTSFRGEFEQRLKEIIAEATHAPDVILFIDEIHTMIGTGNTSGSLDTANILKPALARGDITIIGATTHDEYKKHIEKDAALARRFQKVTLREPTLRELRRILTQALPLFTKHHRVHFAPESVDAVIEQSARYITEQHFPDKAFDVIDETAARLRSPRAHRDLEESILTARESLAALTQEKNTLLSEHNYDAASAIQKAETRLEKELEKREQQLAVKQAQIQPTITREDIAETISIMTSIPREIILEQPEKRIERARAHLTRSVIGQSHAIETITNTVTKSSLGISDPARPRGSFLLAGPTGVGKTLTAEILARDIYGSDDALIRIDMSTLGERHTSSALLGAPAGYVGHGDSMTLVEKVNRRPYSVILFDEIEKAHPQTLTTLLQILENGSLTDNEGRTADFRHSIIILTSNIGARPEGAATLGFDADASDTQHFDIAIRETLAPEFIARLDHIITYNTLTQKDLQKIARLHLTTLITRLAQRGITLRAPRTVTAHIAERAERVHGGARAVRRIIQDDVETAIAGALAADATTDQTMTLTVADDRIAIAETV